MEPVTCRSCERRMVPGNVRHDPVAEQIRRESGVQLHAGRGLCGACHTRYRKAGTLEDWSRTTMPAGDVLEDWPMLYDAEVSMAENIRRNAPRLGLSFKALEQHLVRAGIRSDTSRYGVAA